jgi:hypothetical protein
MYLKDIGYDWIGLAQDCDLWWAFPNTVVNVMIL